MNPERRSSRSMMLFAMSLWTFAACRDGGEADLPEDWRDAEPIDDFVQMPCRGSALDPASKEEIVVRGGRGSIAMAYDHAHFRCEQDVEGFWRHNGATIDVLVQPVDMNPSRVAACDCLYDLAMTLPVSAGTYDVTVSRRWDSINNDNEPVRVGSASVEVR